MLDTGSSSFRFAFSALALNCEAHPAALERFLLPHSVAGMFLLFSTFQWKLENTVSQGLLASMAERRGREEDG